MHPTYYRYEFHAPAPVEEFESPLLLAFMAAESLHGEATVRLDAGYYVDPVKRVCVIDASTLAGRDVSRFFVKYLSREFGDDAFSVERIEGSLHNKPKEFAT